MTVTAIVSVTPIATLVGNVPETQLLSNQLLTTNRSYLHSESLNLALHERCQRGASVKPLFRLLMALCKGQILENVRSCVQTMGESSYIRRTLDAHQGHLPPTSHRTCEALSGGPLLWRLYFENGAPLRNVKHHTSLTGVHHSPTSS